MNCTKRIKRVKFNGPHFFFSVLFEMQQYLFEKKVRWFLMHCDSILHQKIWSFQVKYSNKKMQAKIINNYPYARQHARSFSTLIIHDIWLYRWIGNSHSIFLILLITMTICRNTFMICFLSQNSNFWFFSLILHRESLNGPILNSHIHIIIKPSSSYLVCLCASYSLISRG